MALLKGQVVVGLPPGLPPSWVIYNTIQYIQDTKLSEILERHQGKYICVNNLIKGKSFVKTYSRTLDTQISLILNSKQWMKYAGVVHYAYHELIYNAQLIGINHEEMY